MSEKSLIRIVAAALLLMVSTAAYSQAMYINSEGNVGVGTEFPDSNLHIFDTTAEVGARSLLRLSNQGPIGFNMENQDANLNWRFAAQTSGFRISLDGTGGREFEVGNDGSMIVGPGGAANLELNSSGDLQIAGVLSQGSSKQWKTDIELVDPLAILKKVAALPIAKWRYRTDTDGITHLGPMAEDFADSFGVGRDRSHIATGDMAGVALAGLQAVVNDLERKNYEIEQLRSELEASENTRDQTISKLKSENARLADRLAIIERLLSEASMVPHSE